METFTFFPLRVGLPFLGKSLRVGLLLFLLLYLEEFFPAAEVFFEDEAYALGVKAVAGEVTVVGLVVHFHGEASVGSEQVAYVEVADEGGGGVGFGALAELAVDEQSVVEHATGEYAFVLCVVEAFVAGRDVGSEVPVVGVERVGEDVVELLADGSAEQALHGQCSLALLLRG